MGACGSSDDRNNRYKRKNEAKNKHMNQSQINNANIDNKPFQYKENNFNIFKIIKDSKIIGEGFLCTISYPDKLDSITVLITSNHILNSADKNLVKK